MHPTATQEFLNARNFLLRHRNDYDVAYRDFRWPRLEHFNWALDVFESQARNNHTPALWVVEEDGQETRLSYAQLSVRSNQVANFLRTVGVKRGERILMMLPNCVPLWEVMLALMKLGAVIVPTTLLVTSSPLRQKSESFPWCQANSPAFV
jgi:acetyl-CoA synthetase